MAQAYEQKKDPDGFLYITYTEESTLGAADLQWKEDRRVSERIRRECPLIYEDN